MSRPSCQPGDDRPSAAFEQDGRVPSGEWRGFYTYGGSTVRNGMDLRLAFRNGRVMGEGLDGIAAFLIRGGYDLSSGRVWFTKTYPGSHDVIYDGYAEGRGIWGTWEIPLFGRGGFHIWPRGEGTTDGRRAAESLPEPLARSAVLVAHPAAPSGAPRGRRPDASSRSPAPRRIAPAAPAVPAFRSPATSEDLA